MYKHDKAASLDMDSRGQLIVQQRLSGWGRCGYVERRRKERVSGSVSLLTYGLLCRKAVEVLRSTD